MNVTNGKPTENMIEIRKLKKSFGSQVVLNELDLVVPRGKITVIIGRSGEGKSVLLKHLMGLMLPDSGSVLIDGEDIAKLREVEIFAMRRKFGMLFQNAALFDSMTVFENIAFPLDEHGGMDKKAISERVHELLHLVGLKENALAKFPSELSGGMRKRVGLARAIALKPVALLYDEPTTGLDPVMTDVVDHLILGMQQHLGVTSVVISHDIAATFAIADKIAMLHEGRILLEGPPETFKNATDPVIKNFLEGKASSQQLMEI